MSILVSISYVDFSHTFMYIEVRTELFHAITKTVTNFDPRNIPIV